MISIELSPEEFNKQIERSDREFKFIWVFVFEYHPLVNVCSKHGKEWDEAELYEEFGGRACKECCESKEVTRVIIDHRRVKALYLEEFE